MGTHRAPKGKHANMHGRPEIFFTRQGGEKIGNSTVERLNLSVLRHATTGIEE